MAVPTSSAGTTSCFVGLQPVARHSTSNGRADELSRYDFLFCGSPTCGKAFYKQWPCRRAQQVRLPVLWVSNLWQGILQAMAVPTSSAGTTSCFVGLQPVARHSTSNGRADELSRYDFLFCGSPTC